MHDSLTFDIQKKQADYLAGRLFLPEFKDWFVGATWNVDAKGNPEAIELTYGIWHALSEYDVDQNLDDLRHAFELMIASSVGRPR
jgi:hypothetical protein